MKEYRAKQQNQEKLLSDDKKITFECGICYHKSY